MARLPAEAKKLLYVVGIGAVFLFAGAEFLDLTLPHGEVAANRQRMLCDYKRQCQKYADARRVCATAGSFETCMSIKSDNYALMKDMCTDDGNFAVSTTAAAPGDFTCNYQRAVDTVFWPAARK
jgi:hypothetical protein